MLLRRATIQTEVRRRAVSSERAGANDDCSPLIRSASLPEDRVDSLVADVFFVVEGADVGRDERFDAVPEPSRRFAERHPGAEPCGRRRVPAVVDPHRPLAHRLQARCHARAQFDPLGRVLLRVRKSSRSGDVRSFCSTHSRSIATSTGGIGTLRGPVFGSPGSSKEMSASVTSRRPQPSAGNSADRTRSITTSDGRKPA